MNKLISTIAFLVIFTSALFSQINLTIRVTDVGGNPRTNVATLMKFKAYPYSGSYLTGITVTHEGNGVYLCTGFTTFQLVQLYVNDTPNVSFGEKLSGDPTTAFVGLSNNQTITGNKTFSGTTTLGSNTSIGNVSATEIGYIDGVTSSIQTQLDAKVTLGTLQNITARKTFLDYLPYAQNSSTQDPLIATTAAELLTKGFWDQYWLYSSSYLQPAYKLRKGNSGAQTALFDFNNSQFTWDATNGLTLQTFPYVDSFSTGKLNIFKTNVVGEVTYQKNWVLSRRFNDQDSATLRWYYYNGTSVTPVLKDSMWAINKLIYAFNDTANIVLSTGTGTPLTSLSIPHWGLWKFEVTIEYVFESGTAGGGPPDSDKVLLTMEMGAKTLDSGTIMHVYDGTAISGCRGAFPMLHFEKIGGASTIYINAYATLQSPNAVKIKRVRIIGELIN